ncbi:hypothetical protein EWM64_g3955 [Hericium alpestre]|uniref:Nucleic acid-binding protein n=1 Tax=Hericium alpestre TaxID=135208 RepID=A0A4Z0A1J1_9AGAM|nr:hypothetical protein EWM64_g3955 [Hericium alpestre]
MLAAARSFSASRASMRTFSTTPSRAADLSKLLLIGRLGKEPEVRMTKSNKEYISYTVATTNFPAPPVNPDGTREESKTTWHHILSFNPNQNNYLRTLPKGTKVYVEANFELREPDPNADPNTAQGQRQIFLRHENVRVLKMPYSQQSSEQSDESS